MPSESAVDIQTEDKGRRARLPLFSARPHLHTRSPPPSACHRASLADAGRDPTGEEGRRARGSGVLVEAGHAGGSGSGPASAVAVERFTESAPRSLGKGITCLHPKGCSLSLNMGQGGFSAKTQCSEVKQRRFEPVSIIIKLLNL